MFPNLLHQKDHLGIFHRYHKILGRTPKPLNEALGGGAWGNVCLTSTIGESSDQEDSGNTWRKGGREAGK